MARTLHHYLFWLMVSRFLLIFIAVTAGILILDLMAFADEVVEEGGDSTAALLRYSLLRAPLVANKLVPFTALIAALVVLTRLVRNSELTAIRAAGVSQLQLMVALLPAALLIAAPQFVLDGWVAPKAVESLRAWGVGEYDRDIDDELTWLRDGNDMVRIRFIDSERGVLHGVTILERNESGDFERQIQATTARFESGRWTLRDVTISEPRKPQPERQAEMVWNTTVGPAMFSAFSEHPSEMNFTRLVQFLENPAYGNRPQYLYETWFHKRLALPATTILIILLCIPLVQRFERTAGTATMILGGVGLGFLYLSFDGVILSIGEAGLLPATFAAWVPTLILMCITGSIAFYFEYHR